MVLLKPVAESLARVVARDIDFTARKMEKEDEASGEDEVCGTAALDAYPT